MDDFLLGCGLDLWSRIILNLQKFSVRRFQAIQMKIKSMDFKFMRPMNVPRICAGL